MNNKLAELLPQKYFVEHPVDRESNAAVLYELYETDALLFPEEVFPDWEPGEDEKEFIEHIKVCTDPKELARAMRKDLPAISRAALFRRILGFEGDVLPLLYPRILTSLQDVFIDNISALLLYVKENPCEWILENYKSVRSPFMQSMLCAVLGMRGTPMLIEFLKDQVDYLGGLAASEPLDQGPLVALETFSYWDPSDEDWDIVFSEDEEAEDDRDYWTTEELAELGVEIPEGFDENNEEHLRLVQEDLKKRLKELAEERIAIFRSEYEKGVSIEHIALALGVSTEQALKVLGVEE